LLLGVCTQFCFKHRRTLVCIGELLMFPIFIVFICFSIILVYFLKYPNYLYLIAVPLSLRLSWSAIDLILSHWKDENETSSRAPILSVLSVRPIFEKQGVKFQIIGKKPQSFSLSAARLYLVGDQLWEAMANVIGKTTISTFKFTAHPINLCNTFMDSKDFKKGTEDFETTLRFGTADQGWIRMNTEHVLTPRLVALQKQGNPPVQIFVEYGVKKLFGWESQGTLFTFNFTFADLLSAVDQKKDLPFGTQSGDNDSQAANSSKQLVSKSVSKEKLN